MTMTRPEAPQGPRARPETSVPIVLFADEWGGYGGTAGYVIMLGRELARRGYNVTALCHGGAGTEGMRKTLVDAGVSVELLPAPHGRSPLRQLRELRALTSMLKPYRHGVLALMMGYFTRGGSVTLAARLAGMKAIVRADLTPPDSAVSRKQALSLRLKDLITDRVVVGAIENIDIFARKANRSPQKLNVIHTGIELGRFRPGEWRSGARAELGYRPEDIVIGTTARLDDERKGIRDFIRAAAKVIELGQTASFLVVGDGVHRGDYERLGQELGIGERLQFAGWRSDVPRMLDAMDVFVMPSLFEGGPTSVLEAMAMAKPVVATNVGMVPEVIEDGRTGLIVPPGQPEPMAAALATLLTDSPGRAEMGSTARERALDSLGVERMTDDYLELFAEVLNRTTPDARERS
jgi:glycosyltransferase involved in cell wall biosynthesis